MKFLVESKAFASIKRGLEQAIGHRKGKRVAKLKLRVPPPVDVKAVRERCPARRCS